MTDYESAYRSFRLQVPGDYEFTRDVVEHWAAQHPGKLALVAVDPRGEDRREISFGDLARASRRSPTPSRARHQRRRAGVRDAPAHPRVVRAAARDVPPRRRADARHDALHGARHRPAHRARAGHGRRRRRRGRRQARDGARPVPVTAPRDRRRRAGGGRRRALRGPAARRQRRGADRRGSRVPTIRCSCTSPRAPWRRRRWCSTRTPRWAPVTRSPRASGRT